MLELLLALELLPLELFDDELLLELLPLELVLELEDELELLEHSSHTSHSSLTVTPQGQSSALKSHGQHFPSPFLHSPSGQSPLELLEVDDVLDELSDDTLELLELVDEDELVVDEEEMLELLEEHFSS